MLRIQSTDASPNALRIATNGAGTNPHGVIDVLLGKCHVSDIQVPDKATAGQMVPVGAGQLLVGVNSNGIAPFVDPGQPRPLVSFGE